MATYKALPYGISDFGQIRNESLYLVDKSMYIETMEKAGHFLFLIRPRRFGKSLFLSMLRYYYDIAEKYGVEVVFRPFIKVEGLTSKEFRQSKISISDYTAVIFTAKTAIDHYFRLCEEMRIAIPDTMKYFCTSETIAHYLQKYITYRKRKIFYGVSGKLDDEKLLKDLVKHNKEKFLFPISDVHRDNLSVLDANKIPYTKAIMYRTVSNDFSKDEPFDYDMLIFFSPAGIKSLLKNFPDFQQGDIKIGCFGETTAKAVEADGLRLDLSAPNAEATSMTAALDMYLKKVQGRN